MYICIYVRLNCFVFAPKSLTVIPYDSWYIAIKEINVISSYIALHGGITKVGKMLTNPKIIVSNKQWKSRMPFQRMYCASSRASLKWWEWRFIRISEQCVPYYLPYSSVYRGINQIGMNLRCAQNQFHFIDQFFTGSERRSNMWSDKEVL